MIKEYFAIVERLIVLTEVESNKLIIDSHRFYSFVDKNLYIKRNEKLKIYKQLNLINCNSRGFTSVVYDKETRKTQRKVILNIDSYNILKMLHENIIEK